MPKTPSPRTLWTLSAAALVSLAGTALGQDADNHDHDHAQPAAAPSAQPPADPATAPNIEAERTEHDFGVIMDTDKQETTFTFTNTGQGTLQILGRPQASCGCTVPDLAKTEYAPGESGSISVTFNPHGKKGDQLQVITLRTNDPDSPEFRFQIKAHVKSLIQFEPTAAVFTEVLEDKAASQVVTVTGAADDFEVSYVTVNRPRQFDVRVLGVKDLPSAGGATTRVAEVEVTAKPGLPRGRHQATVTVRTNDPRVPVASFQIVADVVGDMRVLPARLNLGASDPGQRFERLFRLQSRTGRPFRILGIDFDNTLPEDLSWTVTPTNPSEPEGSQTAYEIKIAGTAPQETGPVRGMLIVSTDSASDPQIEMPVQGVVRPAPPPPPAPVPYTPPAGIGQPGAAPAPAPAPAPQGERPE